MAATDRKSQVGDSSFLPETPDGTSESRFQFNTNSAEAAPLPKSYALMPPDAARTMSKVTQFISDIEKRPGQKRNSLPEDVVTNVPRGKLLSFKV
jgi:hypothetical protein